MAKLTGKISEVDDSAARQIQSYSNTNVDKSAGVVLDALGGIVENVSTFISEEKALSAFNAAKTTYEDTVEDSVIDPDFEVKIRKDFEKMGKRIPAGASRSTLLSLRQRTEEKALRLKYTSRKAQVIIDKVFGNPMGSLQIRAANVEAAAATTAANVRASQIAEASSVLDPNTFIKKNGVLDEDALLAAHNEMITAGLIHESVNSAGKKTPSSKDGRIRRESIPTLDLAKKHMDDIVISNLNSIFKTLRDVNPTDPVAFKGATQAAMLAITNLEPDLRQKYDGLNDAEYNYILGPAREDIAEWREILKADDITSGGALEKFNTNVKNAVESNKVLIEMGLQSQPMYKSVVALRAIVGDTALAKVLTFVDTSFQQLKDIRDEAGVAPPGMLNWSYGQAAKKVVTGEGAPDPSSNLENSINASVLEGIGSQNTGEGDPEKTKELWDRAAVAFSNSDLSTSSYDNQKVLINNVTNLQGFKRLKSLIESDPEAGVFVAMKTADAVTQSGADSIRKLIEFQLSPNAKGMTIVNDQGRLKIETYPENRGSAPRKAFTDKANSLIKNVNNTMEKAVTLAPLVGAKGSDTQIRETVNYNLYNNMFEKALASVMPPRDWFSSFPNTPKKWEEGGAWLQIGDFNTWNFRALIPSDTPKAPPVTETPQNKVLNWQTLQPELNP